MVSAKTMANGYQPSKGETWGKANTTNNKTKTHNQSFFTVFFYNQKSENIQRR